jgi:hypothetical protein
MSDKFDRDPELDDLLRPLKSSRPKGSHVAAWQAAVESELFRRSWFRRQVQALPQMVAGLAIGFLVAAWYFHPAAPENSADAIEMSATIHYAFAKSE